MVSRKHTHSTREDNSSKEEEKIVIVPDTTETAAIKPKVNIALSRLKRRILKHVVFIRVLILTAVFGVLAICGILFFRYIKTTEMGMYGGLLRDFITAPEAKINAFEGKTNILVLGKGGQGHEAPDLTDSIMVVSISHESPRVQLLSLPRDIWIPELRTKLNSIYYWGNKKETGGGLVLAKSSVEEILGLPIHYGAVVDFSGFKKIIDTLGGVEVDVVNSFTDKKYPVPGRENDTCGGDREFKCRYETVSFEKGKQFMDGETALKFSRSRNAEGDEGTDIARAARQEQVVKGIKNKLLSKEIITQPKKLFEIRDVFLSAIETDLSPSASAIVARRFYNARENLKSSVIPENLLEVPKYSPLYDNLYVFIPRKSDPEDSTKRSWSEVHVWVKCILSDSEECN